MDVLELAEQAAEPLRQEPYHLIFNNCLTKSARLKRALESRGISVRVVGCVGVARAWWLGRPLDIPVIHGWAEVNGKRIETSRPLNSPGVWGIVPADIRPVAALRF